MAGAQGGTLRRNWYIRNSKDKQVRFLSRYSLSFVRQVQINAVPWLLSWALTIGSMCRCKNEVSLDLDLDGAYLGIHCILIAADSGTTRLLWKRHLACV